MEDLGKRKLLRAHLAQKHLTAEPANFSSVLHIITEESGAEYPSSPNLGCVVTLFFISSE